MITITAATAITTMPIARPTGHAPDAAKLVISPPVSPVPGRFYVTATLTVEQRPQRTRTFLVICIACMDAARTLPHSTHT